MALPNPPSGWGTDEITRYLDVAQSNSYETFHNLPDEYNKLAAIDAEFRRAVDSLPNTKDWFAAFFLLQTHSAFLGGVHLAMGRQVSEGYACLRLSLENALYGFYLFSNPGSLETWLARHASDVAKEKVRKEFKIRALFDALNGTNTHEAQVAEALYNQTINYGAHPNEKALMHRMQMDRVGEKN